MIGFAHRGASVAERDNTIPAFTLALNLGATGLESDAWLTSDGVAVLDHDGVVRRGVRRRSIASLPRAALPRHIPTVADLYAIPGADAVEVSLDVRDPAALAAVLDAAGPARRRLWLCGGDLPTLASWRAADPDVHVVHSTALRRIGPDPAGHPRVLAGAGVDALNLRAGEWSAPLVQACHAAGVVAFAWDAQRRDVVERMAAMRIDGVYSDDVEMMVAALRTA